MLAILIASTFLRQIFGLVKELSSLAFIKNSLWLALIFCFGYVIIKIRNEKLQLIPTSLSLLFALIIFSFCEIPEERFHLFEFGLLGLLLSKDLRSFSPIWPIAAGFVWGVIDELLQALLPYRVGDLRDVHLNTICVCYGVFLGYALNFRLSHRNPQIR